MQQWTWNGKSSSKAMKKSLEVIPESTKRQKEKRRCYIDGHSQK